MPGRNPHGAVHGLPTGTALSVLSARDFDIAHTASRIVRGELSCLELVETCLKRIDEGDGHIRAWAAVDYEGARLQARALDAERQEGGYRGPLHGIPIGIKDIFHTVGMATEAGSRVLKGFEPTYDATAVRKLREAGAIIIGKTHTSEFATQEPAPTRNPWNLAHTPGGSSAGSAAAVAAGMCLAALGSQTAGSTLRPAVYNGLVGLKPQYGRISLHGVIPVSYQLDHVGILTRSVQDAATILDALAGYDAADPRTIRETPPRYDIATLKPGLPRLAKPRDSFFTQVDDEMGDQVEMVATAARSAGAVVEEITFPTPLDAIPPNLSTILMSDLAEYHEELYAAKRAEYGPTVARFVEQGLETSGVQYSAALRHRSRTIAEFRGIASRFDAIITPGTPSAAPEGLTTTGDPVMQGPWTYAGFPSLSLPTALNGNGLPLGIQLLGSAFDEAGLIAAARWIEGVLNIQLPWPAVAR